MTGPRDRRGSDGGETLIELLVTIVLLGIAGVAILGAMMIAIDSSVLHRRQAQAQAGLRSWAEQLSGRYDDCATSYPGPTDGPAGFTWAVKNVKYWDGTAFVDTCPAPDKGIQRVTLEVDVPSSIYPGFTNRLDVVVRKPCESSC